MGITDIKHWCKIEELGTTIANKLGLKSGKAENEVIARKPQAPQFKVVNTGETLTNSTSP